MLLQTFSNCWSFCSLSAVNFIASLIKAASCAYEGELYLFFSLYLIALEELPALEEFLPLWITYLGDKTGHDADQKCPSHSDICFR